MAVTYAAVYILTLVTLVVCVPREKSLDEVPMVDYAMGTEYTYHYRTFTEINEPHVPYVTNNSLNYVGQSIVADVLVSKIYDDGEDSILSVKINSASITNMAHNVSKQLTTLSARPFYVHSKEDKVRQVYAIKGNDKLTNNYIRGVASLFTLQSFLGRYTEYDSAGRCSTRYTSLRKHNKSIEKSKIKCSEDPKSEANQALGVHVVCDRTASYLLTTVSNRSIIGAVVSAERFRNQVGLEVTIGSQAHVQQEFDYKSSKLTETDRKSSSLEDMINTLNKEQYFKIGLTTEKFEFKKEIRSIESVLKEGRDLLISDYIGRSTDSTRLFLDLVEAIRDESDPAVLKKMLVDTKNKAIISTTIDALVAAQTKASHKVLVAFIRFDSDETTFAERYLLSTSFVPKPSEDTVEFLLTLFGRKISNQNIKEMISLTLGAVIHTFSFQTKPSHPIFKRFEAEIAQEFVVCGLDLPCRLRLLGSIANSGSVKFIDLLLRLVESDNQELREAALLSFRLIDIVYEKKVENSMFAIYANLRAPDNAATLRLLALDVLLRVGIDQRIVYDVLRGARCTRNKEFNLMVRNRLVIKAKAEPVFEKYLIKAMKKINVYDYEIMMKSATGIAFTGVLSHMRSGRLDYNMLVHNTEGGAMVRSGLDVIVSGNGHYTSVYKFGLFTEGLDYMLGDKSAQESDLEPTAGMRLNFQGVGLRPVRFFRGNSQMLSAVWSAPADLTSALQDFRHSYLLSNGMIGEVNSLAALSLDISASLIVSLWNKNSKSLIRNSASMSLRGELYIGERSVGVTYSGHGKGQIDFKTDVDFSSETKMCLQMEQPNFDFKFKFEKYEKNIKKNRKFCSRLSLAINVPGKSLPLPDTNNRMCADMKL